MRLNWRGTSRGEDQFEAWLNERQRHRVLGADAPSGPCPDPSFLHGLARRSKAISLTDPRVDHAAECPGCLRSLLEIRSEISRWRRRATLIAGLATCVILLAVLFLVPRFWVHRPTSTSGVTFTRTLDLSGLGTYRGAEPAPLSSVSLPQALVRVHVVLPRFSPAGAYEVAVTRDQGGDDVVAKGTGTVQEHKDREDLAVLLDLRNAEPGLYFISTTHEQDQATYYYPLRIQ